MGNLNFNKIRILLKKSRLQIKKSHKYCITTASTLKFGHIIKQTNALLPHKGTAIRPIVE